MSRLPPQRVLVTGAAGFVGSKLVRRLEGSLPGADLILADHAGSGQPPAGTDQMDVSNASAVDQLIAKTRPEAIVHLAAVSDVASSSADPRQTWRINTLGTLNIVLAILDHAPQCHLIFASSGEVYGRSAFAGKPVGEDALLQPANNYAAAKAAADLLVQEAAARNLFATVVRPFNHTGPGQTAGFAVPSFCSQIARIEKGLQPPSIKVGELDDERDFLDVEDVVDLYATLVERGHSLPNGLVLNVASGVPRKMRDVLDTLLADSFAAIAVEVDPSRLRAARVPRILGNASRARELLGWAPTRAFETTLRETLDYWRGRV